MITKLKKWTIQMVTGANVATIGIMLLVGYSDHIHPAQHPLLSTVGMTFPFFIVVNMLFLFFWILFKWTRLWIPVVGFLLAYVPITIYLPLNPSAKPADSTLKVVSYNVCTYGGNHKYDNAVEVIMEYLADEKPDIVCVQEDTDNRHRRLFDAYRRIGLTYNDTAAIESNSRSRNCIGIHTRYPIVRRERIDYPSATGNGSMAWWLDRGGDTLIVVNNHFESCHLTQTDRHQYKQILKGEMARDSVRSESKMLIVKLAEANAKRSVQIDRVCQFVKEHPEHSVIVCGDFNDNPISYSRYAMAKQLTDCYVTVGNGIGLSYNQKGFNFRIDHLFCSKDIEPLECRIDSKMDASDHYPVVCRLKIADNH